MGNFRAYLGLWRSQLIYNAKPFNRRRLRRFYADFIQPGDLCFDLGAHVGNRTACWRELGATVVSVEPQPFLMQYLRKRFRNQAEVILVEKAVGETIGTAALHVPALNPTIGTLSETWKDVMHGWHPDLDWGKPISIPVTTLDALIAEHGVPQFCKIDVEHYEEPVLRGLHTPLPTLSFEFFPDTRPAAIRCIGLLEKLGTYTYNWSLAETLTLASPTWCSAETITDWLSAYTGRRSGDIYARLR